MANDTAASQSAPTTLKRPLYVLTNGVYVGKSRDSISLRRNGQVMSETPAGEIDSLNIFGNAQMTSQAIALLMEHNIPIFHFSYSGYLRGVTVSSEGSDVALRTRQFAAATNGRKVLRFTTAITDAKNRSRATILRRYHDDIHPLTLETLSDLRKQIASADSMEHLRHQEAEATNLYRAQFTEMLADAGKACMPDMPEGEKNLPSRRRYPKTTVDVTTSFTYAVLLRYVLTSLIRAGLDPYRGLYHESKPGSPGLAVDMREEFCQPIGDYVVVRLFRQGGLAQTDFKTGRYGDPFLNDDGCQKVINAIERRLSTEVKHRAFEYAISYRRVIGAQTDALVDLLMDDEEYAGFSIR